MEINSLLIGAGIGASGTVLATLITSIFNHYIKKQEYRNLYHKIILDKRVSACEIINTLIGTLKISILDDKDKLPYHNIFHDQADFAGLLTYFSKIMEYELWLSDETKKRLQDLRKLIINCSYQLSTRNLLDIGKENYKEIAILRDQLERDFIKDLSKLHEIDKFLKKKTVLTVFAHSNDYFNAKGII